MIDRKPRVPEKVWELDDLEPIFQLVQLFFERYTFKQGDAFNVPSIPKKFLEESSIAIVMRTAEQDLVAMDIM